MGRTEWHVEEKGFLLALARLQVLNRFTRQTGKHVDGRVMGDDLVVFDHGLHVSARDGSPKMIEAPVKGTIGILAPTGGLVILPRILLSALGIKVLEIEVPLSDDRRVVALLL